MKARSQFSSIPTKNFRRSGTQRNALSWTKTSVLRELERLADRRVRVKMAYFSVNVPKALGISAPLLHALAKRIGRDHRLAQQLWATGVHEARILATLIGQSKKVTSSGDGALGAGFRLLGRGGCGVLLSLCPCQASLEQSDGLEPAPGRVCKACELFLNCLPQLQR